MKHLRTALLGALYAVVLGWLTACSDGSDHQTTTQAQALLTQFGAGATLFSEAGMQELLDFPDASSPVTLLQIMSVRDDAGFARYEREIANVLDQAGAELTFASRITGQLIGDREFTEVRVIEFPNSAMLLDALRSAEFAAAMDTLFAATGDHAWTLGVRQPVPPKFTTSYADPALQNRDREEALALLAANGNIETRPGSSLAADEDVLIDMIVSDSPEPFYMVNLIDYYAQAQYSDGRESAITGLEANTLYGQMIAPTLFAFQSGPVLVMDVQVKLTRESSDWERAVIVRYASRDAFLNIFPLNPQGEEALVHKEASVAKTLVYVSEERHATPPEPVNGILYNVRYCEILLATLGAGITVNVYGTQGLNLCPQEQWDALDRSAVASDFGATLAFFNGPRFFVVDWTSNTEGLAEGDSLYFGDLEMRLLTTVIPAAGAAAGETAYRVNRVARNNVWHYVAGRRIYELEDPEGRRYRMQSFSRSVDADLQLEELATLDAQLALPEGWRYSSRVLTNSEDVPAIDGTAEVIQDNLANTYQRVPD